MHRILIPAFLLTLTACGTPQQQCIAAVSRDLTVVDRLIAETQGNLDRGYAYGQSIETTPEFVDCTPDPTPRRPNPRPASCFEDVQHTVTKPVAIDLNAEAAKLASLRSKRTQLAAAVSPQIAACQQRYPE